jgi:ABC-type nitrate/sulfonate/bicarbonate transport system permease component
MNARRGSLTSAARGFVGIVRTEMPPVWGFIPLILLIVVWDLVVEPGTSPFFPPPSEWFRELREIHGDSLITNLGATLRSVVVGLGIATAIGALVGVAIGISPIARRSTSTSIEFLRTLPAPTIIPIALLALGPNESMKVFAVAFASVWPVLLNTAQGAASVNRTLVDVSRTFHVTRPDYLRKIVLPSTVPAVLLGMRVALPVALIVSVLTEMLVSTGGIGRDLIDAQRDYRAASAFGLLFVVGVFGYLLNASFVIIEGLVLKRWPRGTAVK